MFIRILGQTSGAALKLGYVLAMLWLYASRPLLLAASLCLLSVLGLLAVSAQTRR